MYLCIHYPGTRRWIFFLRLDAMMIDSKSYLVFLNRTRLETWNYMYCCIHIWAPYHVHTSHYSVDYYSCVIENNSWTTGRTSSNNETTGKRAHQKNKKTLVVSCHGETRLLSSVNNNTHFNGFLGLVGGIAPEGSPWLGHHWLYYHAHTDTVYYSRQTRPPKQKNKKVLGRWVYIQVTDRPTEPGCSAN